MKKILITGMSGMLGKDIYSFFNSSKKYSIHGLDKLRSERLPSENQFIGDLTDAEFLTNTLNKFNPDVIIHCAAIVNLQICEKNKALAKSVHVDATKIMADFSPMKTKLIFISTDSVFDGEKGNYNESDEINPLNYYSKSKVFGEEATRIHSNHLIIRTNIFGFNLPLKNSLAEWAIQSFNKGQEMFGFTDIMFNAIYTKHFAEILYLLIEKDIKGTINLASKNNLSKYSFLKYFGAVYSSKHYLIKSSNSKEINFTIKRPKNTTLNVNKLLNIINLPTIEEGIEKLVKDYFKEKQL